MADQLEAVPHKTNTVAFALTKHDELRKEFLAFKTAMENKVTFLEEENSKLRSQLEILQKEKAPPNQQHNKNLYTDILKIGTVQNHALMSTIAKNQRMQTDRAAKIVVVGVQNSPKETQEERTIDDTAIISDILAKINSPTNIVSVKRLASRSQTSESKPNSPAPLIVEFESTDARNKVISSARNLASTQYKNIFIRPDRTPSEQSNFNEINNMKKKLNDELKANSKLDQPFRYVVRGDSVRCIDVTQTVKIGGVDKHPFVDERLAAAARKRPAAQNQSSQATRPTPAPAPASVSPQATSNQ